MAPGVRWRLRRPDGVDQAMVGAEVASIMAQVYEGRAGLEALGIDGEEDTGGALKLDRIAGYASVLTACLYARRCLLEWEGMSDPEGPEPLDITDADAVQAALLVGLPDGSTPPLLTPFLAWVEGPRRPMAADANRLRRLAKDHWSGGAERCRACVMDKEDCARGASLEGEYCPRLANTPCTPQGIVAWSIASTTSGLWQRAGMSAVLTGLDYRAALLAFETMCDARAETSDVGAAFTAFRAIEQGRMEAEAERADAEAAANG